MDQEPGRAAIEFDHHSSEFAADAPRRLREFREQCPVAHTEAWGGFKVVTRYEDVVAIAKDTPTSTASGARESPLSERIASFSCAELPSGLSLVIGIPYFFEKVEIISP